MSDILATSEEISQISEFLNQHDIELIHLNEAIHGFVSGVKIKKGTLLVGNNATLDSILHEAGHLAITPKPFRHLMSGNLSSGLKKMFEVLSDKNLDPDSELMRHSIQCSDPEATAWAFAAGRLLGFKDDLIILNSSYDGEGALVREMLASNAYVGIHGLRHAGMCAHGIAARSRGIPAYPQMLRWTQDGPYEELDLNTEQNPLVSRRRLKP